MHTKFWKENLNDEISFHLGVKIIVNREDKRAYNGFIWLRIRTSVEHIQTH